MDDRCARLATNGTATSSIAHAIEAATKARRRKTDIRPSNGTLPRMPSPIGRRLAGVALVSAALLMTELALTRIFSVVMYYHFAFLAISIALFGVSASGVFAYLARRRLDRFDTDTMLAAESIVYAVATIVALFWLVRSRARAHRGRRRVRARAADRRSALRPRGLRHRRHQGAPRRHGAVQQMERVLAHRGLRARARRLVAQPGIQRTAARDAVHGHRFRRVDADSRPR